MGDYKKRIADALLAEKLSYLENKIDTTKMKKPAFKMILVADGDFAYRRKDGIVVCPIGCLKD